MYPVKRLREIRELELLLFGGVPETPEPMYERDVHSFSDFRTTRRGIASPPGSTHPDGTTVGYMEIDIQTGEITISEFSEEDRKHV